MRYTAGRLPEGQESTTGSDGEREGRVLSRCRAGCPGGAAGHKRKEWQGRRGCAGQVICAGGVGAVACWRAGPREAASRVLLTAMEAPLAGWQHKVGLITWEGGPHTCAAQAGARQPAAPALRFLGQRRQRWLRSLVHAGSDGQEGEGVGVALAAGTGATLVSCGFVAACVSRQGPPACAAARRLRRHRGVGLQRGGRVPRGAGRRWVRLDGRGLCRQQACSAGRV